jgi:hypothetical protein
MTSEPMKMSAISPVGAENRVTSRDLHVLMGKTAEPVSSEDAGGCRRA